MININQILKEKVDEGCSKILLEPNLQTNKLLITTTRDLRGTSSENELVRREKHCKVVNTYRNQKKTGMQIIKTEI